MLPKALVGQTHAGAYICREWELRVTARCLAEDLGRPGDSFEDILDEEIVKAFVASRSTRHYGTRQVSPLTCGKEVWVIARGHDHRGGTWFDPVDRVIWLLAYQLHRSGSPDDFFPYCKELDRRQSLLPTVSDLERLIRDRAARFAYAIRIEAPLILKQARGELREQRAVLGGEFGVRVAIEVADDLESTTVAFVGYTVPTDYLPVILAAFHPDGHWDLIDRMPSRGLNPDEFAFEHIHERQ